MADRRRRRRTKTSEDSEELSDGSEREHSGGKESGGESELERPTVESEYESAEEEDAAEDPEGGGVKKKQQTVPPAVVESSQESSPPPPTTPHQLGDGDALDEDVRPHRHPEEGEESSPLRPDVKQVDEESFSANEEDEGEEYLLQDGELLEIHEYGGEGEISGDLVDEEGGVEEAADIEVECEFIERDDLNEDELLEGEYFEGERQQGDGEESATPVPPKEKVLDDDEDRRNPQYIPKKGSFYEHDDRLGSEPEEEEPPKENNKEKDKGKKKKLWLDEGRWGHDMYREEEQGPKSRDELVAVYGYDIRNEDNAPRARRRRRYGRGPNKYTRNWQDEDAYFKARLDAGEIPMRGGRGRGRGKGSYRRTIEEEEDSQILDNTPARGPNESLSSEDFPALPSTNNNDRDDRTAEIVRAPSPVETTPPAPAEPDLSSDDSAVVKTLTFQNSRLSQGPPPPLGRGRGRGSNNRERRPPRRGGRQSRRNNNFRGGYNDEEDERNEEGMLEEQMDKLSLSEQQQQQHHHHAPQQLSSYRESKPPPRREVRRENNNMPKSSAEIQRGGDSTSNRPKRYSSLRQRSLPETSASYPTPQPTVPTQYYEAGYQTAMYPGDSGPSQPPPAPVPQPPPLLNPFQGYSQPTFQETFAMRPPMATPPRLFAPPVTLPAGPPAPTVAYIAPAANLINYAPPPAPPPQGYPHFSFQQFPTPAPPGPVVSMGPIAQERPGPNGQQPELFRGGITYYNTHSQQHMGRFLPQKRPKAAIPILPPPNAEDKDDGKVQVDEGGSSQTVEVES